MLFRSPKLDLTVPIAEVARSEAVAPGHERTAQAQGESTPLTDDSAPNGDGSRAGDVLQARLRHEALTEATSHARAEDVRSTRAKGRPKKVLPQNPIDAAHADFDAAMADLADLLADKTGARKKLTADQEQKLLPVLTRLMDAAFRLG